MKLLTVISISGLLSLAARGALIVSYAENSDDFTTKLSNTTVFDFNSIALGKKTTATTWTDASSNTVGSYNNLYIKAADKYGGAGNPAGSNYAVVGSNFVSTSTLTLTTPSAYFGFWWSAGDATNVMSFYNGVTLVAQFSTDTLLTAIAGSPEYKGSPVTNYLNQDNTESFAFVNFFGESGTTWDKIVFSNSVNASGFESDNHTSRVGAWGTQPEEVGQPYPGKVFASVSGNTVTVIPEPSAALLSVVGALACFRRRR